MKRHTILVISEFLTDFVKSVTKKALVKTSFQRTGRICIADTLDAKLVNVEKYTGKKMTPAETCQEIQKMCGY